MGATTPDVDVYIVDFKDTSAKEAVYERDDGSYCIFLNARMDHACNLRSYHHAMGHILRNDFENGNVQRIENEAHRLKSGY